MAKNKPLFWIVQRRSDDRMRCTDGKWRTCVSGIEDWKTYKTDWRAIKYGLNYEDGTAYAIYDGDSIDRDGRIWRTENHYSNVSGVCCTGPMIERKRSNFGD